MPTILYVHLVSQTTEIIIETDLDECQSGDNGCDVNADCYQH